MTDREDKVYKAKLAEQAERYDGKLVNISWYWCNQGRDQGPRVRLWHSDDKMGEIVQIIDKQLQYIYNNTTDQDNSSLASTFWKIWSVGAFS